MHVGFTESLHRISSFTLRGSQKLWAFYVRGEIKCLIAPTKIPRTEPSMNQEIKLKTMEIFQAV